MLVIDNFITVFFLKDYAAILNKSSRQIFLLVNFARLPKNVFNCISHKKLKEKTFQTYKVIYIYIYNYNLKLTSYVKTISLLEKLTYIY